jgi:hypothetical protein
MEGSVLRARDNFQRVHSRIVDSVQFKIQREIHIRDDEISRLKSDLAQLRGKAHTAADTTQTSQKQITDRHSHLRNKVAEAKTNADMKRTRLALEHENVMQELESRHRSEVAALDSMLEGVMLSPRSTDPDPIDEFLDSMRPAHTSYKPAQAGYRLEPTGGHTPGQADHTFAHSGRGHAPKGPRPAAGKGAKKYDNLGRIEELDRLKHEIGAQEGLAGELRAKIQEAMKNPPEIEPEIETATGPALDGLRASHKQKMSDLEGQLRAEVDRGCAIDAAIAQANGEAERAPTRLKGTRTKRQTSKAQTATRRSTSLSTTDRQARVAALRFENRSLKKEIARVDFILYGRKGKYQMWKGIV